MTNKPHENDEYLRWSAGGDDYSDYEPPESANSCRNCPFFVRERPESRYQPTDPPDCNHPIAYRSATLPTFPFINGCKHSPLR